MGLGLFPDWTWIVGAYIGAAVGSFLNVVIYRLPRGISIRKPAWSYCPSCKARLGIADLIPLFSWLFLRGKCRHCKSSISSRYFWVEIVCASLFGAVWWQQLCQGDNWVAAIGFSLFAAALVAAIFTDLAHYIIPDEINAAMLVIGLGINAAIIGLGDKVVNLGLEEGAGWMWRMPSSIAGALTGIGVLWGIAFLGRLLFKKDAMGHGDIKMARGIGAVLLPVLSLISFGLAVILGAVLGILLISLRRKDEVEDGSSQEEEFEEPESLLSLIKCGLGYVLCIDVIGLFFPKLYEAWFGENPFSVEEFEEEPEVSLTMIPFGPYLAAGALVALLFGEHLQGAVEAYFRSAAGP